MAKRLNVPVLEFDTSTLFFFYHDVYPTDSTSVPISFNSADDPVEQMVKEGSLSFTPTALAANKGGLGLYEDDSNDTVPSPLTDSAIGKYSTTVRRLVCRALRVAVNIGSHLTLDLIITRHFLLFWTMKKKFDGV